MTLPIVVYTSESTRLIMALKRNELCGLQKFHSYRAVLLPPRHPRTLQNTQLYLKDTSKYLCVFIFFIIFDCLQTCLLLRFLHIFYAFWLRNAHYESLLQNYAHEKVPIFQVQVFVHSAMTHKRMIMFVLKYTLNKQAD